MQGKSLKGCVAQLIAYVKVDLVNQIHDSGVKKHGMNITKSRPKEEMLKMGSGKYVRRKKGQIFLSEKILQKQDATNDDTNAENDKRNESPVAPPMTEKPQLTKMKYFRILIYENIIIR